MTPESMKLGIVGANVHTPVDLTIKLNTTNQRDKTEKTHKAENKKKPKKKKKAKKAMEQKKETEEENSDDSEISEEDSPKTRPPHKFRSARAGLLTIPYGGLRQ